jgi:plastocyanin
MRHTIYPLACLILLLVLLAACSSEQLPLTSVVDVQITQSGCHPMEWRVPAGQTISLKLSNKAGKDYTWILMGRPATPPFDASDAANIFFAQQVTAGASASVQFHTPAAAGEYQVICSPLDHGAEEQSGRITVVQP